MDSASSSEIVEAVSPKFDGYGATYMSMIPEEKRKCVEAELKRLGATYMSMIPEEKRKCVEAELKRLGATYMSMSAEEERKCIEAGLECLGVTYMSMRAEGERKCEEAQLERLGAYMSMRVEKARKFKEAQLERLGDALHARYVILAPICLSVTGYKHQGSNETKGILVVGQFMPKHLATMKEVKATIAEECKKSTYNYRLVDGFDITEDTLVKQLSFAVVHPCTLCNSVEHGDGGCYGEVKVDVREIYNALLNKEKYVEYQMYCKHDASLMGSVMFSKLKKPATGWKGKVSGVGKKAKKVLPYVPAAASVLSGGIGLIVKQ